MIDPDRAELRDEIETLRQELAEANRYRAVADRAMEYHAAVVGWAALSPSDVWDALEAAITATQQ